MLPLNQTRPWKYYIALVIVFSIVVGVNFTKPFGFFRESNPALVAINANYWDRHPEIRKQNIPVASYAFDKTKPPASQFDHTITTFGYAWFSVPYYFLKATAMRPGPVSIRIFSVLWLLVTLAAVYKLTRQLDSRPDANKSTLLTVALYVLSPVVMWYQVNGYVHETAVLPFYYFAWYAFLKLIDEKKTRWLWITAVCLFAGLQFDWLPVFQGIVMSAYLLFSRKERLSQWMFTIPAIAVALGIIYIIHTYTSWSSIKDYFSFMQWKFSSRTIGQEGHSFLSFWPPKLNILLFYVISYGILLGWSVFGLIRKRLHPLLWLMIITAIVHHIVFWGFSSEHDYATLKMAFPLVFAAVMALRQMKKQTAMISFVAITCSSIVLYFFLHNYDLRKGMYEDEQFFVKAGQLISKQPVGHHVFVNTENKYFPQVEFYGGRPYKMALSVEDARRQLLMAGSTSTAVFIQVAPKDSDSAGTVTYIQP